LFRQIYKPNFVPALSNRVSNKIAIAKQSESAGRSHLSGHNVATMPQAALRVAILRPTRPCTGWGLPLLNVAIQEMRVGSQLFTFYQHKILASIVSVALSLYRDYQVL